MRGFIEPTTPPHRYADTETREVLGLTMRQAIADAQALADKYETETLVYFKRRDFDLEPDVDRYDWCTNYQATQEGWPDGDRIVWSSEEGYY